jgi:predicted HD superfamily hydrolase involved in NAD metabolism
MMTELDKDRYEHTLGVMYTAASLAMRYDEDIEKALIAGLLHDCAKCLSGDTKIKLCKKYHLNVSEVEKENPSLLHAKLGAFLAAKKYHIKDKDIINAIASHTTGCPHMSLLDKIIYIADYIEPGRKELPNMAEVRKLAFTDIDACLYRILKDSLEYLTGMNVPIDPMTEKTYLYYKSKREEKEEQYG